MYSLFFLMNCRQALYVNVFQAWIYLLLIKACLLFYSYVFNTITFFLAFLSVSIIIENIRLNIIGLQRFFNYYYIDNGSTDRVLLIAPNSPFASCSLINIDFLLPYSAHFYKTIDFRFCLSWPPSAFSFCIFSWL